MKSGTPHVTVLALALGLTAAANGTAASDSFASPRIEELRVLRRVTPPFPERMVTEGVHRGKVRLSVLVDSAGRVRDSLITAYTHKPFADVSMASLQRWKFKPIRIDGVPGETVLNLEFVFETGGTLVRQKMPGDTLGDSEFPLNQITYRVFDVSELDAKPRPVSVVEPQYLDAWRNLGISGRVVVEFYLDETGQPRMPIAPSRGVHPLLAGAAIAALEHWRFEPPLRNGQPVLARLDQAFYFQP